MNRIHEFMYRDIDFEGKKILDAATGAGECLKILAELVHSTESKNSHIISIDHDFPQIWIDKITEELGENNSYVELKEADIFDLSFIEDSSIDLVNCDDTLIFLNPKPLKVLDALKEFDRVLKPGGTLLIATEIGVDNDELDNIGQWLRWNFAKSIMVLKGKTWSCEIEGEELKRSVEMLGFEIAGYKEFESRKIMNFKPAADEWREIMTEEINSLQYYDPSLKKSLMSAMNDIYNKIYEDEFLMGPPFYVLKAVKK